MAISLLYKPVGHNEQLLAPSELENLPVWQPLHEEERSFAAAYPLGHFGQAVDSTYAAYLPTAHFAHVLDPLLDAYCPDAHELQLVDSCELW